MIIVKATPYDLEGVMKVTEEAREYLRNVQIPQWQNDYPSLIDFSEDVEYERLYVVKQDSIVIGMFSLVYPDHNYDYIEDGAWFDNSPYIAIHRMAISNEHKGKGVAGKVFDFVKENYDHIRVDTHALNNAMNRAIKKNDFKYCGVVYMEDKTPRNAYEWTRKQTKIISNYNFQQETDNLNL